MAFNRVEHFGIQGASQTERERDRENTRNGYIEDDCVDKDAD